MTTTALILSPSPSLVPGRLLAPTPKAACANVLGMTNTKFGCGMAVVKAQH